MARTRKSITSQDLYKYDVLIEDSGPRSDYFKISQFDGHFYGGRNAFLLAGSNVLKTGTKILVEVLNKDGTVVYSAPVPSFIEGDSRLIQIEVYDDTPIGVGKIVILGCAETYTDGTPIPTQWKDKYNVRWITDVVISPTQPNNTKIRFTNLPNVIVNEKFYFAPSSSLFSRQVSHSMNVQISPKNFNVYQNGYVIKATSGSFTNKDLNGIITGSIHFEGPNGPESASIALPLSKIYNSTLAESDGQLIYTDKNTLISSVPLNCDISGIFYQYDCYMEPYGQIGMSASLWVKYDELISYYTGSANSYAQIRITNLNTISGEIYKTRISNKSSTSPGEYTLLGDTNLRVVELITADSGSKIVELGKFSNVVISDYWYAETMSIARTDINPTMPSCYTTCSMTASYRPIVRDSTNLLDAATVILPLTNGDFSNPAESYFLGNLSNCPITLFPNSEYTLSFEAVASIASQSIGWQGNDTILEAYLIPASGSTVQLYDTNPRGQFLGSLTPNAGFQKQNFDKVEFNFTPKIIQSGQFYLRFIIYGAFWSIANVSIKAATEHFYNPDEVTILLPNNDKYNELLTYKAQFLDVNNNSINIEAESLPTEFVGFHKYVERAGDTVYGDFTISGSFKVQNALEKNTIYATGMGTSYNYDTRTQSVVFYSGSATNNCTVNFRGDSTTSLNSIMSIGQSLTVVLMVYNSGVAYYPNAYQIDGNSVTPKWINGTAPTSGNPNGIDSYTYTIIKSADATFTVLASQVKFA